MSLSKQIHMYSVDTSAFYNEEENELNTKMNELFFFRKELEKISNKIKDNPDEVKEIKNYKTYINKSIQAFKDGLYELFKKNNQIRVLRDNYISEYKIISVFESALTRSIGTPENTLTKDLIIVKTYFYDILKDIILNGFIFEGEKYVCLTASAGQIRTKKTVFIKESVLHKIQDTLMCGLSVEKINNAGGVNINKYLAYLALSNSATDLWEGFDINKTIVVDDMETLVRSTVDFIDDETYQITRKEMDINISHTDGCGMMLPRVCDKNLMVRLPWIKGLLSPFEFDVFIKEHNCSGIIKDIYGKEHNIIEEDIQIIFTKSQFKMWKYYSDWDSYKENYIKYSCQAGKCNEEEDEFNDAKINYQMLQTLIDITDEELTKIAQNTIDSITHISKERRTMLKVLGVKKANTNKNYLQQAIEVYPEILSDTYCKEILKEVKKSLVKKAKAGKLDINQSLYTFIIPDLYAFCEFLFLVNENPQGLLNDGDVYCKLFKDSPKLDCLRSPHLYREHAVRNNVIDEIKDKWFITNGLYTSCHDSISKILMFDNDGDRSLVVADPLFIEIAERNMEGIVPLYYNMKKAGAEIITNESIYNGLITAYSGGAIGVVSNNITKIWNSENVNLDIIKIECLLNNFVIDYAKTLYKPIIPIEVNKMLAEYTKLKVPHFFIYAKDKNKNNVEPINNSVVNRLDRIIPNPKINFNKINLGNFDYKMLKHDKDDTPIDQNIINKYTELDLKKRFIDISSLSENNPTTDLYLYTDIKNKILEVNNDKYYVVDVLIEFLYKEKKSDWKTTLWVCFGDIIIENLKNNIQVKRKYCESCGELIIQSSNRKKYCKKCWKEKRKEKDREYQKKKYDSRRLEKS